MSWSLQNWFIDENYKLVYICVAKYNQFCKQLFNAAYIVTFMWCSVHVIETMYFGIQHF